MSKIFESISRANESCGSRRADLLQSAINMLAIEYVQAHDEMGNRAGDAIANLNDGIAESCRHLIDQQIHN